MRIILFSYILGANEKMITAVVVDDDLDLVEVFSEYLRINGIDVVGKGENGKDAVELFFKLKPDFLFLDLNMPKFDGYYALQKIRESDLNAKVVIITAQRNYDRDILKQLQPTAIFEKPFDVKKIPELIKNLSLSKNSLV